MNVFDNFPELIRYLVDLFDSSCVLNGGMKASCLFWDSSWINKCLKPVCLKPVPGESGYWR